MPSLPPIIAVNPVSSAAGSAAGRSSVFPYTSSSGIGRLGGRQIFEAKGTLDTGDIGSSEC
jgi:hypothetical protein